MLGLAAACVLGTALEMLWPHPLRTAKAETTPGKSAEVAPIPPLALTPDYVTAIEHPLFTVDRRPYEVPPSAQPAEAAPAAPELNAQLIAVVRVGEEQMILMRLGQAVRKLRGGETIDGWTVQRIDARSATVSNGSVERTLDLNPVSVARR
jgi:hypothetical protein